MALSNQPISLQALNRFTGGAGGGVLEGRKERDKKREEREKERRRREGEK